MNYPFMLTSNRPLIHGVEANRKLVCFFIGSVFYIELFVPIDSYYSVGASLPL